MVNLNVFKRTLALLSSVALLIPPLQNIYGIDGIYYNFIRNIYSYDNILFTRKT